LTGKEKTVGKKAIEKKGIDVQLEEAWDNKYGGIQSKLTKDIVTLSRETFDFYFKEGKSHIASALKRGITEVDVASHLTAAHFALEGAIEVASGKLLLIGKGKYFFVDISLESDPMPRVDFENLNKAVLKLLSLSKTAYVYGIERGFDLTSDTSPFYQDKLRIPEEHKPLLAEAKLNFEMASLGSSLRLGDLEISDRLKEIESKATSSGLTDVLSKVKELRKQFSDMLNELV